MSALSPSEMVLVITTTHVYSVVEIVDWRTKELPQEQLEVRFEASFLTIALVVNKSLDEVITLSGYVAVQAAAAFLKCSQSQLRAHQGVGYDRSIFVETLGSGPLPKPLQERLAL